jgi:chromosome segregation ATPase
MRSKQQIVAKAHESAEIWEMSVAELSSFLDISKATIYRWRRRAKRAAALCAEVQPKTRMVEVTVESVRRKWEEKYATLNKQYEYMAESLIEMAQKADSHRNAESRLNDALDVANEIIAQLKKDIRNLTEKKSWIQRLFSSKE